MHHHLKTSRPYEAMINYMPEGFLYFKAIPCLSKGQADYRLIDINKSFESILGLLKDQIIDKNFSEISMINKNTSLYFSTLLEKVQFANNVAQLEIYNPHAKQWHSCSIFHEDDDCFTALFRDITESKAMEARLDHNEKYKYYFDLSTDMLFIRDFKNNLIEFNPAWYTTLGYTSDELLSVKSWDLIHPEDLSRTKSEYESMMKGKKIIGFENRFLCKNGKYKWLSWNIYSDLDRDLFYAVIRDISIQKNIENRLRQSEERLQFALEGSGAGVWDWNMQTNETVYTKTWKTMLGYEEHEISSSPDEWHSRIHPDDIEIVNTEHKKYFNGETPGYACEYRMRCKDGQYKWVLSSGKIMQWDKDGKPRRMAGIHTDITELKNLLDEYIKLSQDYEIIFNGTQDAMFLVAADEDEKVRFTRLNSTHEKLTGFTTQMVSGLTPPEVLGEELGTIVENNYLKCFKEKRPIQYEELMKLPSGEKIWQTLLSPVIRDGKVVCIVGSSRDITEQREIEELKRKADKEIEMLNHSIAHENLKNEFFSNLSHELRTPLNVIFASLQLVDLKVNNYPDISLKNALGKYFKSMRQNCFRLIRLVNNLIDITRIDAGYLALSLENQNIVSVVEDITLSVAEYIENKSITLTFDTETEERFMAIDSDKIERIMLNLLSNAVKFTKSGGEITVNLYERDKKFYISVKDNGFGIPQDKLNMIFERFIQVDKSLTRKREGSGIGLALVKSLVELHEGKITVNSREGEGSEFIIELPIRLVPENECPHHEENKIEDGVIERISIEFSDIYI